MKAQHADNYSILLLFLPRESVLGNVRTQGLRSGISAQELVIQSEPVEEIGM